MIASLLANKRLILIGGLLLTFGVMAFNIKIKKNKIEKQALEITNLTTLLNQTIDANHSNQLTIAELQEVNQQCVLQRKANEENAAIEVKRHQGALSDIQKKYDELRKIKVFSGCADVVISDDVIKLLQAGSGDGN